MLDMQWVEVESISSNSELSAKFEGTEQNKYTCYLNMPQVHRAAERSSLLNHADHRPDNLALHVIKRYGFKFALLFGLAFCAIMHSKTQLPIAVRSYPMKLLKETDVRSTWSGDTLLLNKKNRKLLGMNYDIRQGPDWDPNRCKSNATIHQEIEILSYLTANIRTYSLSDCNVIPVLEAAQKFNLTVWLGVWISADPQVYLREVNALVTILTTTSLLESQVIGFNIGSEAMYRREVQPADAIAYLNHFKSVLTTHGVHGIPLAITDVIDIYLKYPMLIKAVDIITINDFPFWNDKCNSVVHAKSIIHGSISELKKIANGKQIVITETGWPTAGRTTDPLRVLSSPTSALKYLDDFRAIADEQNWQYYYFASFDTPYKQFVKPYEDTVEMNFGIFYANGTMKSVFREAGY